MKPKTIIIILGFVFALVIFNKISYAYVVPCLNCETQQTANYTQDISAGLILNAPQNLNLIWNSTGNISVFVENKNNVGLSCTLEMDQLYNTTAGNITISANNLHQVWNKTFYIYSVQDFLNPNTYNVVTNISAPQNCGPQKIYDLNFTLYHYEQYCSSDSNSSTYVVKLSCVSGYYSGTALNKIIVNFQNPATKTCIVNCTNVRITQPINVTVNQTANEIKNSGAQPNNFISSIISVFNTNPLFKFLQRLFGVT